jgi:hypothetical protein
MYRVHNYRRNSEDVPAKFKQFLDKLIDDFYNIVKRILYDDEVICFDYDNFIINRVPTEDFKDNDFVSMVLTLDDNNNVILSVTENMFKHKNRLDKIKSLRN